MFQRFVGILALFCIDQLATSSIRLRANCCISNMGNTNEVKHWKIVTTNWRLS